MLKVVSGQFHPSLESALVEQIRRLKAADPWARVAVLALPSRSSTGSGGYWPSITGYRLLNLHLFTFHQFALRLADELGSRPGPPPIRVVDELFFEHLVRHLVEQQLAESRALGQLGHSFGTWRRSGRPSGISRTEESMPLRRCRHSAKDVLVRRMRNGSTHCFHFRRPSSKSLPASAWARPTI
jgi:hypothetical protein